MQINRRTLFRCRPRVVTVLVFLITASVLILSNLNVDPEWHSGHVWQKAYGWPLIWHRYVAVSWGYADWRTVGWFYSPGRLAANLTIWTGLLLGASAVSEWLLRRYRPRLRFSLRMLLVVVGAVAALCGGFITARRHADLQDQIIAEAPGAWGGKAVLLRRWGPRWLDLVGADRYRRNIVGFGFPPLSYRLDERGLAILGRLARLPHLEYLGCEVDRFTPDVVAALNALRHLRYLSVEHAVDYTHDDNTQERRRQGCLPPLSKLTRLQQLDLRDVSLDGESLKGLARLKSLSLARTGFDDDAAVGHECLVAIGETCSLEHLDMHGMKIRGDSLAFLSQLGELKSLALSFVSTDGPSLLKHLPPLPRLEMLDLGYCDVSDEDLAYLPTLPRLKALDLSRTLVTAQGLSRLASLKSLEELALDGDMVSPEGLKSLRAHKQLKILHLDRSGFPAYTRFAKLTLDNGKELSVLASHADEFRQELQALRQARPGLVIDAGRWQIERGSLFSNDFTMERDGDWFAPPTWLPKADWPWLTALEQADFKARGGRVSFAAVTWKEETVSF